MTSSPCADYRRVAVVAPGRRVDLVVPPDLPIAELLPELLDLARVNAADGAPGWQLGRVGGPRFAADRSLDDLGVRDGDLLMLRPADLPDPLPVVDEITDVTAAVAAELGVVRPDHGPRLAIAVVGGLLAAAAPSAWDNRATAPAALVAVAVLLVLGALAVRSGRHPSLATVLGTAGLGCAAIAVVGVTFPAPRAELLIGAGVMMIGTPLLSMVLGSDRAAFAALAAVAALGVPAGAVYALTTAEPPAVAAGVLVAATTILPWAPRLAARISRLPHPDTTPVGDDGPLPVWELADLQRSASSAAGVLLGSDLGLATITGLCALVLAGKGETWSTVLATLGVLVLLIRARSVQIAQQACALAVPGAVALVGGLMLGAGHLPAEAGHWLPMAAVALAGVVVGCGVVGPTRQWSPTARRAARACETVVILAVVPVAVAAVHGYSKVRHG